MSQEYKTIKGSERRPGPTAKLLGPADAAETFTVTIVLRRRTDGPPLPALEHFLSAPPEERQRMAPDEFAAKYGASPDDIAKVVQFASAEGLKVVETSAERRTVILSGNVAQMSKAFRVELGRYEHEVIRRRGEKPQTETYRGRDGVIQLPADEPIVVGVFGLDAAESRSTTAHGSPNTVPLSVNRITNCMTSPRTPRRGRRSESSLKVVTWLPISA